MSFLPTVSGKGEEVNSYKTEGKYLGFVLLWRLISVQPAGNICVEMA